MSKKNTLPFLYLAGMALVIIGFFCPMFTAFGHKGANGFSFIDFSKGSLVSTGAFLIIAGAVCGVVFCFVQLKAPLPVKFIALAASILGGILLVMGFNSNVFYKAIGKAIVKHSAIGFWLVLAGWITATIGKTTQK